MMIELDQMPQIGIQEWLRRTLARIDLSSAARALGPPHGSGPWESVGALDIHAPAGGETARLHALWLILLAEEPMVSDDDIDMHALLADTVRTLLHTLLYRLFPRALYAEVHIGHRWEVFMRRPAPRACAAAPDASCVDAAPVSLLAAVSTPLN
jgi:hypothetical protein